MRRSVTSASSALSRQGLVEAEDGSAQVEIGFSAFYVLQVVLEAVHHARP
jgi:hypothetical protein